MGAEHKARMTGKPTVDTDRTFIVGGRPNLVDVKPHLIAFGLAGLPLSEEQDVDHDIRTGRRGESCPRAGGSRRSGRRI